MYKSANAVIRSADRKDTEAVGVIDGIFGIGLKRTPRPPVDFCEIDKAEVTLAYANVLHARGQHRDAFLASIRATRELLFALHTEQSMHEPLKHLFDALFDLEKGSIDPALKPEKIDNRSVEPSAEWNARACLACALEARMALGISERNAADEIRKRFTIIPGKPTIDRAKAIGRLIDWRKQLRSGRPHSGDVIYNTGSEQIAAICLHHRGDDKTVRLRRAEIMMLDWAADYRQRMSSKPDPRRGV